jgi:hypothetical protein
MFYHLVEVIVAKQKPPSQYAQTVLVVPGTLCEECRQPIDTIGALTRNPSWLSCQKCWLARQPAPDEKQREIDHYSSFRPADVSPANIPEPRPLTIPPTPASAKHIAEVIVSDRAAGNLVMRPDGQFQLLAFPDSFGDWNRPDLPFPDAYRPTDDEIAQACILASGLPLHSPEWYGEVGDDVMAFGLRCPAESHPEAWRAVSLRHLPRSWQSPLARAGIDCLGLLAYYLESGKSLADVKGMKKDLPMLMDCLRSIWTIHTREGQRGEYPDWLGGAALDLTPQRTEEQHQRDLLWAALHPDESQAAEWDRLRLRGVTDQVLRLTLGSLWRNGRRRAEAWHATGGKDPKVWLGQAGPIGPPTLRGAPLLAKVREVLGLKEGE